MQGYEKQSGFRVNRSGAASDCVKKALHLTYDMLQDKRLHGPHRGVLDKYLDGLQALLQEARTLVEESEVNNG